MKNEYKKLGLAEIREGIPDYNPEFKKTFLFGIKCIILFLLIFGVVIVGILIIVANS